MDTEEEPKTLSTDEKINSLLSLIEEQKKEPWEPAFEKILDVFEDFLMQRPEPPQEWKERFEASGKTFDYYQIVLPADFQDPYEDDLGNIRRLRGEFAGTKPSMALEHLLLSRNYFIFENGHASPIAAPRPILILESAMDEEDDRHEEPEWTGDLMDSILRKEPLKRVEWDCSFTLFPDGSFCAYNLDNDEEEELGEDFRDVIKKHLEVLSKMRMVIPQEGVDYGVLHS